MTELQFTVTVQIDGAAAGDIAHELGIDLEAGDFDLPLVQMFRAQLQALRDTRDWRIVAATVTFPGEVTA
jgi:hypothetical protein